MVLLLVDFLRLLALITDGSIVHMRRCCGPFVAESIAVFALGSETWLLISRWVLVVVNDCLVEVLVKSRDSNISCSGIVVKFISCCTNVTLSQFMLIQYSISVFNTKSNLQFLTHFKNFNIIRRIYHPYENSLENLSPLLSFRINHCAYRPNQLP